MRTAVVRGREDSGYFLADAPADAVSWEDHVKPATRQAWGHSVCGLQARPQRQDHSQSHTLIYLTVAAHAHQDDLLLAQLQLQGDAILEIDGNSMQPRETPRQRV